MWRLNDIRIGARPIFLVIDMITIENKMIITNRAMMPVEKLQHISWKITQSKCEIKLYSCNSNPIVQECDNSELETFLQHLKGVV